MLHRVLHSLQNVRQVQKYSLLAGNLATAKKLGNFDRKRTKFDQMTVCRSFYSALPSFL